MRMTVRALVVVSVAQAFGPAFAQQNSDAIENFISVNAEVIALTHVRVIDGTGAAARDDQTIIVRDEAIAALGDAARTPVQLGVREPDLFKTVVLDEDVRRRLGTSGGPQPKQLDECDGWG